MKVYGYTRVSGLKQERGCEVQRELIRQCCERERLSEPIFYEDNATSTSEVPFEKRPGMSALRAVIEAGDVLVVWRLDRIERGFFTGCAAVKAIIDAGVAIRSVEEHNGAELDLSKASGRAMFAIYEIAADHFRESIRENTTRALQWRKERGLLIPTPCMFQRRVFDDHRHHIANEWEFDQLAIVAEAAARLGKGEKPQEILRDFWNRGFKDWRGLPWGFYPRNPQSKSHFPFYFVRKYVRYFRRMGLQGKLPEPYSATFIKRHIPATSRFTEMPKRWPNRKKPAENMRVTPIYDSIEPWSPWNPKRKPKEPDDG